MRAGARAGIKNVIELTYRLGMPKDPKHMLQPYPTTAIGASEVNPLSMASTAAFLNGGFRVTPRFANDVCHNGKSLLYKDEEDDPKECDTKGANHPPHERLLHPAVSAAMIELLKGPLDIRGTGTASAIRSGIIPGMDPLSDEVWKLKPEERKKRMLAFPIEAAGELALVWEEEASIAGFVCAHDLGFRAYLSELIVAQGARGRGIGRSLVERIQAELARQGCRILIADVWHDAEPFYRSLGWEPPDVVLLRRKLGGGAG
jgi:GNAT superfamily N-acetyltransferase